MSATYELKATARTRVGKGAARTARREGLIPAVIYGDKKAPLPISLSYKEAFMRLHAGGFLTTVCTIDVDGEKHRVIPRDYQLDPVRDFLIHVDFLRIAEGAKLTVGVPVHFVNEAGSPGLKRGGVLNIVRHEVELECPVDAIPEFITCDLTGTDIGDSIHISTIKLPDGVTPAITDRDFTVATIASSAGAREDARGHDDDVEAGEVPLVGGKED
ncbi:MAG: 50S ribosomal protein L25/general stress protein Ctc [Hyphomicrobiales bacterium]